MSDVITLSREQQDFLNCQSNYVCCMAYAGSGKTFILEKFSEKYKEHRILYLAYNKGIQQEAQRKFPDNVKVVTTHALAYRYFADLKQKMKLNFGIFDLAKEFNITSFSLRFIVYKTLSNFYFSADENINISHVPKESKNKKTIYKEPERIEALSIAIKAYRLQADPENDFPCPPDFFIKHYQLTGPSLDKWYDIILLDEAQDVNMVTKALLDKCSCMRIYVGDPHQMINRWRGSFDVLSAAASEGAKVLRLTESYRFGRKVAAIANVILRLKGENIPLRAYKEDKLLPKKTIQQIYPRTIISRSNLSVIFNAIDAGSKGKKISFVGGVEKYSLWDIVDYYYLKLNEKEKIKNKAILEKYPSWDTLVKIAKITTDSTLTRAIVLIDEHGSNVTDIVDSITKLSIKSQDEADLILVTAHSSKGLDWNVVEIDGDFPSMIEYLERIGNKTDQIDYAYINDELNLLYVAVTRAIDTLGISACVMELIMHMQRLQKANKFKPLVSPSQRLC